MKTGMLVGNLLIEGIGTWIAGVSRQKRTGFGIHFLHMFMCLSLSPLLSPYLCHFLKKPFPGHPI
jgi:hypothetical protein